MTDARSPRRRGRIDSQVPATRRPRPDAPPRRESAPPRREGTPPPPAPDAGPRTEAARTFARWIDQVAPAAGAPHAEAAPAFGRRPRRHAEPPHAGEPAPGPAPPPAAAESAPSGGFTSFVHERAERPPLPVPQRPAAPEGAPGNGRDRDRDRGDRRGRDRREGRPFRGPRPEGGSSRPNGGMREERARQGRPNGGMREERPRQQGRPNGGDFRSREGGGRDRDRGRNRDARARGPAPWPRSDGQAGAVNRSRPLYGNHFEEGKGLVKGRGGDPRRGRDDRRGDPRRFERGRGPARPPEDERDSPALPTNPREAALRILHAADTRSAFSDRLLDGAHQRGGPDPRDLALMHEIVKGTLRWRGRIDWALDQRVHIGLAQTQPWIRNILRLGAYQVLFLDRVPAHAAVDEAVKLAHKYGHPGTAGLVNSVLRRLADEQSTIAWPEGEDVDSLAVWGSHPRWLVERWLARFGVEGVRALMMANNRPLPSGLRVNALRASRAALIERLAKEGVEATPARLSPDVAWIEGNHSPAALAAFKDGWCTVQDESEALVGRLVDPQQHERLLDMCAAPGGKSTHLAELMQDEGEVWALERNEARVASLQATVTRLGAHAVHVVHGDGQTYTFPMPFDRVLVDAPCSGLGVIGRRADARWRKGPEVLAEMPPVQLELLAAGGRRARPGGVLIYSVCSFEPEETEAVVERFLRQNPQFVLERVSGSVPDEVVDADGFMRLLPHVHGCDGAFAARFRKT